MPLFYTTQKAVLLVRVSRRIYVNIKESDITTETDNFIFYFSKDINKTKFDERIGMNRQELFYKFSSRYDIEVIASDYFDIILYMQIEKFGFRIYVKGVNYECLHQRYLKLNGLMMMTVNLHEQQESLIQREHG